MARFAVLILCIVAAACAPVTAHLEIGQATPFIESASLVTRDGTHLPLRVWAAAEPRAVIVALHGMSDYSNAFDLPATWWAEQGVTTYAYDQRSFGATPDPKLWPGDEALRRDLADRRFVLEQRIARHAPQQLDVVARPDLEAFTGNGHRGNRMGSQP